jgi:cytochrome c oxidase assembly protein subunit 15
MTSAAASAEAASSRSRAGAVRAWLYAVAALVFAIVVVGGATRLTESGLSITEWEVVTGVVPPLTPEQWQVEFEKYRRIPQYRDVNRGMSLAEFQTIYLWEWAHRLLGRVIGAAFLIPFLGFLVAGRLDRGLAWRLFGIGLLIGLQGAVGWWMVTSGLVDRVTVAPYRLAAHLTLACVIFAALVWTAWGSAERPVRAAAPSHLARGAGALVAVLFLQIFLGALVAGTRAGYTYQTWPLMDGWLWPSGLWAMEPWLRNFFENTATTQFMHRMVAYALLGLAVWHLVAVRRAGATALAPGAVAVAAALAVQAALGVATLLSGMHILVALAHQAWIVPTLYVALRHLRASTSPEAATLTLR